MYKAQAGDHNYDIDITNEGISIEGEILDWDISKIDENYFHIIHNNKSYKAEILNIDYDTKSVSLKLNGTKIDIEVKDKMDILLEKLGMDQANSQKINDVKAPMPGLILDIPIQEGDEVKEGDVIMILEAMKMENVLKAAGDGKVKEVKVKKGDSVEKNQILIQFD